MIRTPDATVRTYLIEPQTVFVPFLTRLLADAGLSVIATNQEVDPKHIVAHDPAAIVVDVDFFARGAPNALCRIRQVAREVPLIAFSESDDPTFEAACYISGASAVLSKGCGAETMLRSVRGALKAPAARPLSA